MKQRRNRRLPHLRVIAFGYLIMIGVGTLLLMLPFATRARTCADPLTALFTATSASCVTGLVRQDTATYWSLFGQLVILALIQVGGLGFMTFAILLRKLVRRHTGLRGRAVMAESINTGTIGGIERLTRHIAVGTALFEGTGAVLLACRFVPRFGFFKGVYYGVFHAVSAFCNAGFDLMGAQYGAYSSFTAYAGDWLVNLVLIVLITAGGIGFLVWEDFLRHGLRFRRWRLHTKLVLIFSAALLFGGAALLWLFERNDTAAGLSVSEQVLTSLFGSVTARTAGFNTTDTAALSEGGRLLTIVLMFIGGSSGSTAGGIKTTSMAVLLLTTLAAMRGHKEASCLGRRFEEGTLRRAVTIFFTNLGLALTGTAVICATGRFALSDALFEAFSAIGTVGMTTGITRDLGLAAQLFLVFLMYCGRVGSISFAAAILEKKSAPPVTYPPEEITVG